MKQCEILTLAGERCPTQRAEVATLKTIVNEIDPEAFMAIGVAHEALGEGFAPLKGR